MFFIAYFALLMLSNTTSMAADHLGNCQMLSTSKALLKQIPSDTTQLIVVKTLGGIEANMALCQRKGTIWQPVFASVFQAVIGENGMAPIGKKKEGDLKTPEGLYPIGDAFGTQALALNMDYKYITSDDKFIDDVNSKDYNSWVTGPTDAKSYESMLIEPYAYGLVINYNMKPTLLGAGSAVFIHLWRAPNVPTAGCVALEEKNLLTLLHWLDKKQHPYILIV